MAYSYRGDVEQNTVRCCALYVYICAKEYDKSSDDCNQVGERDATFRPKRRALQENNGSLSHL